MDVRLLATGNMLVQVALMAAVIVAAVLAKRKYLDRHCLVVRVAVVLQLIAIALVMLPSLLGYLTKESPGPFFLAETLVHHTLGLAVIALWVYINLAMRGAVKASGRLVGYMRAAFIMWLLSFLIGVHLYLVIWVWS